MHRAHCTVAAVAADVKQDRNATWLAEHVGWGRAMTTLSAVKRSRADSPSRQASGGTPSMLDERGVVRPEIHTGERDDHSMQLTEYALAIIALAAAVLLAVAR
jgi:hypothetical protein